MKAAFIIMAVVMIFMFVFTANSDKLGTAKPILSAAFFGLALLWGFEFALVIKPQKINRKTSSEIQDEFRETIRKKRRK
jgi:preprotein translocase subunit SecD